MIRSESGPGIVEGMRPRDRSRLPRSLDEGGGRGSRAGDPGFDRGPRERSGGLACFVSNLLSGFRVRLLLGLGVGVLLPLLAFSWFGTRRLRETTKESLASHLLRGLARETRERLRRRIFEGVRAADSLFLEDTLRAYLKAVLPPGGPGRREREILRTWLLRHAPDLAPAGRILVLSPDSRLLLDWGPETGPSFVFPAPPSAFFPPSWFGEPDGIRILEPLPDPLEERPNPSGSPDPSSRVLPRVLPIRDSDQALLGFGVSLLPLEILQEELDRTAGVLEGDLGVVHGDVGLVAPTEGGRRILLDSLRFRIGGLPDSGGEEGMLRVTLLLGEPGMEESFPPPLDRWEVEVRASESELLRRVDASGRVFFWLVLGMLLATLGIASSISWALTRPLRRLEEATETLGSGDLSVRVEEMGPRETRKLAHALNTMARQLEEDRRRREQVERDRAWTQMARQVAHEIKNPLQPVRLHAELILRLVGEGLGEPERIRNSSEVILRQVRAMQRIVRGFQDFAKAGEPCSKEWFPLAPILEELRALYAAGENVDLRLPAGDGGGGFLLRGDPLRFQQVLVNLVQNSIEAAETLPARIEIAVFEIPGRLRLEVRDRGRGLPQRSDGDWFEPYASTKEGGTGLGLAICQRQVESMGGRIGLEDREGGGTVAWMEFPSSVFSPGGEEA